MQEMQVLSRSIRCSLAEGSKKNLIDTREKALSANERARQGKCNLDIKLDTTLVLIGDDGTEIVIPADTEGTFYKGASFTAAGPSDKEPKKAYNRPTTRSSNRSRLAKPAKQVLCSFLLKDGVVSVHTNGECVVRPYPSNAYGHIRRREELSGSHLF